MQKKRIYSIEPNYSITELADRLAKVSNRNDGEYIVATNLPEEDKWELCYEASSEYIADVIWLLIKVLFKKTQSNEQWHNIGNRIFDEIIELKDEYNENESRYKT